MKRISIIGTVGIPANYGGFETLAEYLTLHLASQYDITVYCTKKISNIRPVSHNGAKLSYIPLNANGIQSILYDIISIFKSLRYSDSLLILGVSGCISLPVVKLFSKKKIIVNIDGLEWKRDKWGLLSKSFLKLSESLAIKYADTIVCDNKAIQDYVSEEYNTSSHLITYGADHVEPNKMTEELKERYPFLSSKYAFKVCRIEPENNLHIILEAFSEFNELNLVIVGNWDNSTYGKELKSLYNQYQNIFLLDPIYEQRTLNQLRSNCYLYVHGHSAGGTNPSLVEAMYLKLPIYSYDVSYNKETTGHRAKYFSTKNDLIDLLKNITHSELNTLSSSMYELAKISYTWEKISKEYSKLF